MQVLDRKHSETDCSETIVCRCLGVSESTVADAIAVCGLSTIKEICRTTGAGGGCTACHARMKELLRRTNESVPAC